MYSVPFYSWPSRKTEGLFIIRLFHNNVNFQKKKKDPKRIFMFLFCQEARGWYGDKVELEKAPFWYLRTLLGCLFPFHPVDDYCANTACKFKVMFFARGYVITGSAKPKAFHDVTYSRADVSEIAWPNDLISTLEESVNLNND